MHERFLSARFEQAATIKNTRQYHFYELVDDKTIACKLFSNDFLIVKTAMTRKKVRNKYYWKYIWWQRHTMAYVLDAESQFRICYVNY